MKIIIKGGQLVTFSDKGDITEQLKNLERLIITAQNHAANMQKVASRTLNIDPAVLEANEALRRQNAIAQNTINIADGQLRRNREERRAGKGN